MLRQQNLLTGRFKLVILGMSEVGKTALLMRFSHNEFTEKMSVTIGAHFMTRSIVVEDTPIKLDSKYHNNSIHLK